MSTSRAMYVGHTIIHGSKRENGYRFVVDLDFAVQFTNSHHSHLPMMRPGVTEGRQNVGAAGRYCRRLGGTSRYLTLSLTLYAVLSNPSCAVIFT